MRGVSFFSLHLCLSLPLKDPQDINHHQVKGAEEGLHIRILESSKHILQQLDDFLQNQRLFTV